MINSICFVCLGNICRSPLAQGIAEQQIRERDIDLQISSAGTGGWHVGDPPDSRMQQTARRHNIDISGQRAAQVHKKNLDNTDLFIAMDHSNYSNLVSLFGNNQKIVKLLDYHNGSESDVPDPYYGGDDGFETVVTLVTSGVSGLLDMIEQQRTEI